MDPLKNLFTAARTAPLIDSFEEIDKLMPASDDGVWTPLLDALRTAVPKTGYRLIESPSDRSLRSVLARFEGHDVARGVTNADEKTIWLQSEMPDSWKAYVLAHELGHASHATLWDHATYFERELFAESVAFLVLRAAVPQWDNRIAPAYLKNQILGSVLSNKGVPRLFNTEVRAAADAIIASINTALPTVEPVSLAA